MPHYAFILGANQDWPDPTRCTIGDIGLARCLADHCRLPPENLVEVYDERATRTNILRALECLLDRRNKRPKQKGAVDSLLFYYGGHGKPEAFCTQKHVVVDGKTVHEPWIRHSEIIDLLERKFKGGNVWCIIDTCHSGGFGRAVFERYRASEGSLNCSYTCIMSVPPREEAGCEWTMTECFIRAFKGELLCSSGSSDRDMCFLSTKKGKHQTKWSTGDVVAATGTAPTDPLGTRHPTWEEAIEFLADELGRTRGDRLVTLFCGERMKDGKLIKGPCRFNDSSVHETPCSDGLRIPRNETWMDRFRRTRYTVNSGVCVKWTGDSGSDSNCDDASYRLGWFPGRILSIHNGAEDGNNAEQNQSSAAIQLYDVISETYWTVTLPLNPTTPGMNRILGGIPFGFGFDPLPCAKVISRLARHLAYFDTTVPPGRRVKVLWSDGAYYTATTLCRNSIEWDEVSFDSSFEIIGPCVPLYWDEDDSTSFVPTASCVVLDAECCEGTDETLADESTTGDSLASVSTPFDALMASLACAGKTLNKDLPVLGDIANEESPNGWEAFDGEDLEWSGVQLMNSVDLTAVPLQALAYSTCYSEPESFNIVYWDTDSTLSVVPNSCLRPRKGESSRNSSEEESCEDGDTTNYIHEIHLYIDNKCHGAHLEKTRHPVSIRKKLLGAITRCGIELRFSKFGPKQKR